MHIGMGVYTMLLSTVLQLLVLCQVFTMSASEISAFRELYERVPQKRLSSIPRDQIFNRTAEQCAELCVRQESYLCKSFDVNNVRKSCILFMVDHEDTDVTLIHDATVDHYQSAYVRLYDKTPKHRLHTWMNHESVNVSPEQCARMCYLEVRYQCRSFNYDVRQRICRMTQYGDSDGYGLTADATIDFYERKMDDSLKQFINFGQAILTQQVTFDVHSSCESGKTLEECAAQCLDVTQHCRSFDYLHEAEQSACCLSPYTAADVPSGLQPVTSARYNHYQRIQEEMSYFYVSPNSILIGNDIKTYNYVKPNHCAKLCMEEEGFVCRSFDYQANTAECVLSDKTGSDVGGLYYDATTEAHHFEMKPILECGGNMSEAHGDFASPGWPRNYSHHEMCVWNISVPINKVIRLKFTHLQLAVTSQSKECDATSDRLVIVEQGSESCIRQNTATHKTRTNQAFVKFSSNHEKDAQGFRVFYNAEWTCDATFTQAPGDFASPQWPHNYEAVMRCSWRIRAPDGKRVRLYFTSFQLEQHDLGHCNVDVDHVKILDGGSVNAKQIGLFCGHLQPFDIKSSSTDLFIQFFSDADRTAAGFHATFVFEHADMQRTPVLPPAGDGGVRRPGGDSGDKYFDLESSTNGDLNTEISKSKDNDKVLTNDVHNDVLPNDPKTANQKQADVSSGYRGTMWSVITLLLILLCVVSVLLFLVWRHFKRKVDHLTRLLEPIHEPFLADEAVPDRVVYHAKQNNVLQGNEVDLSCQQGACGGAVDFGDDSKYARENTKNVNLYTKHVYDNGTEDKTNHKSNLLPCQADSAAPDKA